MIFSVLVYMAIVVLCYVDCMWYTLRAYLLNTNKTAHIILLMYFNERKKHKPCGTNVLSSSSYILFIKLI